MKKCIKCGFESDDLSGFCSQCGSPLSGAEAVTENINIAPVQPSMNGVPALQEIAPVVEEASVPKKKKKFLFVLIPILIVLLIGSCIAIYCIFFMSKGPASDIIKAAIETVEAQSFTFEVKTDDYKYEGKVALDFEDRDVALLIEKDDGSVMGVYDKYAFKIYDYEWYDREYGTYRCERRYHKSDCSESIDAMFDAWNIAKDSLSNGGIDWDVLFEFAEDLNDDIEKDDLRDRIEEYINLEELSVAITDVFELLNDEKWLEECMGYEKTKNAGVNKYSFDIDLTKIAETIEDTFESCSNSNLVDKVLQMIVEELEDMSSEDEYVSGDICVEDGYICEISFRAGGKDWSDRLKIKISDVGETDLDTDKIKDYLDKCKED